MQKVLVFVQEEEEEEEEQEQEQEQPSPSRAEKPKYWEGRHMQSGAWGGVVERAGHQDWARGAVFRRRRGDQGPSFDWVARARRRSFRVVDAFRDDAHSGCINSSLGCARRVALGITHVAQRLQGFFFPPTYPEVAKAGVGEERTPWPQVSNFFRRGARVRGVVGFDIWWRPCSPRLRRGQRPPGGEDEPAGGRALCRETSGSRWEAAPPPPAFCVPGVPPPRTKAARSPRALTIRLWIYVSRSGACTRVCCRALWH